ncbi:unnamed protein product [Nyctereutes procyonoides]|uniref:(raccoon dog) hypothetical protein n=1 Tax=Nyctereutes procyonoides TaxID=34880 RepID=A0A811YC66_NYCPR|nr:unnamed protein product [Nyctereutes procyonoides]
MFFFNILSWNITSVTSSHIDEYATSTVKQSTTLFSSVFKTGTVTILIPIETSKITTPGIFFHLVTATINSKENAVSKFDVGIVSTLGVLSILDLGDKMYCSRRGIQYRAM